MNIKIGDKEFILKYNNRALFKIEKILDKPVVQIFNSQKDLEKLHTVYAIVYAGIQEEITFDEFSDIANLEDLTAILPDITKEIAEGFNTGSKKK